VPSSADAVERSLALIEALDGELAAWVEVDVDGARAAAKEAIAGPLAGVTVGIKDIIDVAGLPTRLGAGDFAHYRPARDATSVARLRGAGAIILGKTHTTEFAFLDPAPTRNPWNLLHTPGGSSSGSAAAVGSGMAPLALGTQTIGSVIRPAAYCGIVGLKPTFGLISYAGANALAPSFDHVGVLCRSVDDAALALSVLAGHDAADPKSIDAPVEDYLGALGRTPAPRIGIVRAYYRAECGDDVSRHLEAVAERLSAAGATVVDAPMPADAAGFRAAGEAVMRFEAAQVHRERYAQHKDGYRQGIRNLVEAGLATSETEYEASRKAVRELRAGLIRDLQGFDAFLLPCAPTTAPASIETTGQGIFCAPASFAGLPAISLPSGLNAAGMPYAVQLIAGPLAEARLLAAAAWIERVLDFTERPSLP
jgi:Asp-tRNA(Asn)/Glu-tRNA(Gln) amidotransferase A subunit family amidase